jgi:hypothetical protein
MILVASPDFGASGGIFLFVLISGATVYVLVLVGIFRGITLLGSGSAKNRKNGLLLILASGLVSLFCCLGPSLMVRLVYGNFPIGSYPNNKIMQGMSMDEVKLILGNPHVQSNHGDEDRWIYYIDSFGMGWFGVNFGVDGKVTATYGN